MQPYSQDLTARYRPGKGGIRWGQHSLQQGALKIFSKHSCRSGRYKLWLSPVNWARRKHRGEALGYLAIGIPQKQLHGPWPHINLPELASLHPSWGVAEHIIHNTKNWYYRITFSLSLQEHFVTNPRFSGGSRGTPLRSTGCSCRRAKQQKRQPDSPPPPNTRTCIIATLMAASGCKRQHRGFTDLETHCPLCSPVGLMRPDHRGGAHLPRKHSSLWGSEKPEVQES